MQREAITGQLWFDVGLKVDTTIANMEANRTELWFGVGLKVDTTDIQEKRAYPVVV